MSKEFEWGRESILPFIDNWRSIDLRVLAHRVHDKWVFNAIQAVLDPLTVSEPVHKDLPMIDNLLVVHECWDIEQIDELLESILKGELVVGDNVINIKRFDGQNWKLITPDKFRLNNREHCNSRFGIDFASFIIQHYESNLLNYEEHELINHQLRSASKPWDGLKDLRQNFLGLTPDWASSSRNSYLNILAPLYVKIREAILEGTKVKVILDRKIESISEDITLSIFYDLPDDIPDRIRVPIQNDEIIVTLKSSPRKADIKVSYRDFIVDQVELLGKTKNRRIKVFESLRGNVEDFSNEFKKDGRRLENNTCLLFNLLGFSSAHYGYRKGEVPDILAFPKDDKIVLVIECTEREPGLNNKLTKLSTRTKEIAMTLDDVSVLPMVLTGFEHSKINITDIEKAQKEEIAIISHDEISILIHMALNRATSIEVVDYIKGLIPSPYLAY